MINTSYLWKLAIGLLGLSLIGTFSACSRLGVEILPRNKIESHSQEPHMKPLQAAMDDFEKGAYPEAKTQFRQIADNTQNPKLKEQAQLGAVLSDMLSADALADIQDPENELEKMMQQTSSVMSMDIRLLRPFIQNLRENTVLKEENRCLHNEKDADMNRIQALKKENKNLKGQIKELEDLFELIEQQKRRLFLKSQ